jgi:hypothetical protein
MFGLEVQTLLSFGGDRNFALEQRVSVPGQFGFEGLFLEGVDILGLTFAADFFLPI